MNETLREYVDSTGASVRVDRERGWIHGVKIRGLSSRNGRAYRPAALERAAALYEGARVNVNHPSGNPAAVRDYRDRIGSIRNAAYRPEQGLFGDLQFNPRHALAEQLMWDAEHGGENVGLSHNVEARVAREGGWTIVEEILRVHSVDLVSSPATTAGLFEGQAAAQGESRSGQEQPAAESRAAALNQLPAADLQTEVVQLRRTVAEQRAWRAAWEALQEARRCLAGDTPDVAESLLGEEFVETLAKVPERALFERLLRDRVRLVETLAAGGRAWEAPRSAAQRLWERPEGAVTDGRAFAAAIRRR